jgi:hydroxyacylglutathione hydrolase
MLIETFAVGPLACNCSLIADLPSRQALVIDPGGDVQKIRARLARHDLQLQAILLTHAHIDHVAAAKELQGGSGLPVRIHPDDRFLLKMLGVQAAMVGLPLAGSPDANFDLVDGTILPFGPARLTVIHTPGHSPGGVSLLLEGDGEPVLFSGDTLFQGGIGRSDLWGGDAELLLRSIRTRLYTLDPSLRVITGHGGETTIGEERDTNPFVRATP